ncbi:MAG: hypothetical protein E5V62_02980 [Mesorhizobium sp.]|uniref:hypothetical protein n=1 Tax=Mesorhizobium sp. TaxID=1871066 RepID=UPI000FD44F6B|nr:hypothetical protein [Mesorhizobium sp.]RVD72932.1 hypothetical protein EN751_07555 [Mesorhizobium sp. M4A.F.Ca.ET.029.04.2.1]TIW37129.1 MAG: hypothetical protein E5V62_02980 [Mesorhizobium sp.]
MPAPAFDQVDVVLCEDNRTIALCGYVDDVMWMQSFDPLPMPIDEDNLNHDEWRTAARPDAWRCMG